MRTIYGRTSTGTIKSWAQEVIDNGDNTATIKTYTMTNINLEGGKVTVRDTLIKKGKNIDRSNETTPLQQAEKEMASNFNRKIDREEYQPTPQLATAFRSFRPMLATKYTEKKHLVDWTKGWLAQPKLNGIRCTIKKLESGKLTFTSREGMDYTPVLERHAHLVIELENIFLHLPDEVYLDGELFVDGWALNRIGSAVKKYKPDTRSLTFNMFDLSYGHDVFVNFKDRNKTLTALTIDRAYPPEVDCFEFEDYTFVNIIGAQWVHSEEEMMLLHDEYVRQGHEGIILRDPESLYTYFYRVSDLLKFKLFIDEEFLIVDTYCEEQSINGDKRELLCFWCETPAGIRFKVQPKGSHKMRAKWWRDKESFIGKDLTVRYQEWSGNAGGAKNVPVFPKGICVRDYE